MNYLAKQAYCEAEKDDYEKGCFGGYINKTYDMEFSAKTLENLIEKIKEFHGWDNIEADNGVFRYANHETAEGFQPSDHEIEQWKQGKLELWYVETAYHIYELTQVTEL